MIIGRFDYYRQATYGDSLPAFFFDLATIYCSNLLLAPMADTHYQTGLPALSLTSAFQASVTSLTTVGGIAT